MFKPQFPVKALPAFILSACGGLLLTFSLPCFDLYPLCFIALLPLYLAIYKQTPRRAFFYGWVYGLSLGLSSFSWLSGVMAGYGGLGPWGGAAILIILAAFLGLYQGIFAWLTSSWTLRPSPIPFILVSSLFYCGLDYLKNYVFTGFNWTPLALPLALNPHLSGAFDLVGVYGLGYLLAIISASLFAIFVMYTEGDGPRKLLKLGILPLSSVLAIVIYGIITYQHEENKLEGSEVREMAVLQASVDQGYKWDSNYRGEILARYKILATQASFSNPFLIVWSETAAPFLFGSDPYESEWILSLIDELGRPMLMGLTATNYDEDGGFSTRNRAWLIYPGARLGPYYDKTHLVPFGEYIPMEDVFPFLAGPFFQGVLGAAGNFSPGEKISPIVYQGLSFGMLICFESLFPYLARENILAGADILIVTTNDAWFGDSYAPYQHFYHAVARAVETRSPLLRAANNGISGVILPSGRIHERSIHNEVRALIYDVPIPKSRGKTLFVRGGYLVAPLMAIVTTGVFLYRLLKAISAWRLRRKALKGS